MTNNIPKVYIACDCCDDSGSEESLYPADQIRLFGISWLCGGCHEDVQESGDAVGWMDGVTYDDWMRMDLEEKRGQLTHTVAGITLEKYGISLLLSNGDLLGGVVDFCTSPERLQECDDFKLKKVNVTFLQCDDFKVRTPDSEPQTQRVIAALQATNQPIKVRPVDTAGWTTVSLSGPQPMPEEPIDLAEVPGEQTREQVIRGYYAKEGVEVPEPTPEPGAKIFNDPRELEQCTMTNTKVLHKPLKPPVQKRIITPRTSAMIGYPIWVQVDGVDIPHVVYVDLRDEVVCAYELDADGNYIVKSKENGGGVQERYIKGYVVWGYAT